ncbi:hypothetical protein ACFX14_026300 [Malus domestica]
MPLRFLRKQSCWGSGSRDLESGVFSIFEKVIMLGVWLSRFGGRCLFDFGASNLVGSVLSNVSKGWACLLVYLAAKQRLTHMDFPIIQQWYCSFTLSSIFEKVIMLGVWLSRFGGRCLFDFGASNLVGSVFSNVSKGWACLLVYLATKHKS